MAVLTAEDWNLFLDDYPDAHLLQTGAWGDLKAQFGWEPVRVQAGTCGAQILFRRLPLGFSVAYIPKGPIGTDWQVIWPEVEGICRERRSIFLRVEPDEIDHSASWISPELPGFIPGAPVVQPRRTIILDINGGEGAWLARMKQKTRYNIRLAQKKEIVVRQSQNLDEFFTLMHTTGQRDGFGVHSRDYYRLAYQLFQNRNECVLLVAEYQSKPLAAVMTFAHGKRAWYFYGASSDEERQRMPAYLLQYEAMCWASGRGCQLYDLWGVPDYDEVVLEEKFSSRSDGLWGVYRFKRGFGGQLVRSAGAWDRVFMPAIYRLYRRWQDRHVEEL